MADQERRRFLAGLAIAPALSAGHINAGAPALADEFMLSPGLTFLNTASLGPTPKPVLDAVIQAWRDLETEPVSMAYGRTPDTIVSKADQVRGKAAKLLGCRADEVMITTGTTAGMTILAQALALKAGDHILTTDQEHEGGSVGWQHLARMRGLGIDKVAIGFEEQDRDAIVRRFAAAIRPETRIISVSHVITSTGLRMPIVEISELARRRGLLCIVDGAQAVGAIKVDVKALGCHAYATSGHKWLMGPKGTGLLYISDDAGSAIKPVQWEAERRYESNSTGVGPIPVAVGLGVAINRMLGIGPEVVEQRVQSLRDYAWRRLGALGDVRMVGPQPGKLSSGLAACILPDRIDSLGLRQRLLARDRIVAKMIEKRFFNGVRLSPHIFNDKDDIDRAVAAIRSALT